MSVAAILRQLGNQLTTMPPTARIADVARLLAERRTSAVLVADSVDQLLGIVSERDIVQSLAANGARTLEMTAGQLMTRALKTATPRTSIAEAMQTMTAGNFRHLPVLENGTLLGLVSITDVVRARVVQDQGALTA
jgi:CBS domain-containing protein